MRYTFQYRDLPESSPIPDEPLPILPEEPPVPTPPPPKASKPKAVAKRKSAASSAAGQPAKKTKFTSVKSPTGGDLVRAAFDDDPYAFDDDHGEIFLTDCESACLRCFLIYHTYFPWIFFIKIVG